MKKEKKESEKGEEKKKKEKKNEPWSPNSRNSIIKIACTILNVSERDEIFTIAVLFQGNRLIRAVLKVAGPKVHPPNSVRKVDQDHQQQG